MRRLSLEDWRNIFNNLNEMTEEDYFDGEVSWVEVALLEDGDEWCLCYGYELFEDGFKSEEEAQNRLNYLESIIL